MNLLLFSTFRLLRVCRATSFNTSFIARFQHDGSFRPNRRVFDGEVISYPEAWIVKVISTLCVLRCSKTSLDFSWLKYFSRSLNPLIAFEVVKRLNNPSLALEFFRFSRDNCGELNHSAKAYDFLVRSLCQMGHHEAASEVVFDGHLPDSSLLGFLVSSCAEAGKLDIVKGLLIQAHSNEIGVNSFLYNNLLNVLIKRKWVNEAVSFFREQHLRSHFIPDTCSFNIVIRGLCRVGEVDRAFEFLHDMGSFGCSPDIVSYNTLINGLCRADKVERGCELLKEIQSKYDFSPDVVTYTSVISGYCKLYKMKEASVLFEEMVSLGIRPNSFTYNVLIDGFGKSGDMGFAMSMYQRMLLQGCPPDVVTLTSLIDGYCRSGQVDEAMKLWHEMSTRKLSPNAYTFAILINSFCKENRLNEAREFLRQLKWRDIVPQPFLYNPVIDGFCKAGNVDEANLIVSEMEDKRCNPDKLTYTILIIGHCMKGRMSEAITIFHKMLTTGCTPDTITLNSLTSCLCKAGMPNEANKIVLAVSEKNFDLIRPSSRKIDSAMKNIVIPVAAY